MSDQRIESGRRRGVEQRIGPNARNGRFRAVGFGLLLTTLVTACSGSTEQPMVRSADVEETVATGSINLAAFRYRGPESRPVQLRPLVVEATPSEVEGWLSGIVSLAGFTPVRSPEGQFAAVFRGDAGRFVDCGWVDVPGVGTRPGASRSWSLAAEEPAGMTITRELELHTRLVADLTAVDAERTRIAPSVHYVLVKRVVAIDRNGDVVVDQQDVIDFGGGDSARFLAGTECRSSGALETALFSMLPSRVASAAPSLATGRSSSGQT